MDLIQPNGQPNYGRFSALPQHIDLNQYIYKNPYGKVLTGWRKRLKYKKFKFCCIQHQHYTIGLAIADIAWAGHGFHEDGLTAGLEIAAALGAPAPWGAVGRPRVFADKATA